MKHGRWNCLGDREPDTIEGCCRYVKDMKTLLTLFGFTLTLLPMGVAVAEPPDYYVGVGARGGLNDSFAAVIDSKALITELGELSVSARPGLVIGDNVELRLPLSIEGEIYEGIYPYAGGGIAYNQDGRSAVNPMVTGGVDIALARRLYFGAEANAIFRTGDTDFELIGTLNYAF